MNVTGAMLYKYPGILQDPTNKYLTFNFLFAIYNVNVATNMQLQSEYYLTVRCEAV